MTEQMLTLGLALIPILIALVMIYCALTIWEEIRDEVMRSRELRHLRKLQRGRAAQWKEFNDKQETSE